MEPYNCEKLALFYLLFTAKTQKHKVVIPIISIACDIDCLSIANPTPTISASMLVAIA